MTPESARTEIPYYWKGVRKNHVKVQSKFRIMAFDTETCYGKVFATGFWDGRKYQMVHGLKKDHLGFVLGALMQEVDKVGNQKGGRDTRQRETVICGAHYIKFDLGVLLWDVLNPRHSKSVGRAPENLRFCLIGKNYGVPNVELSILFGKPCFGIVRWDFDQSAQWRNGDLKYVWRNRRTAYLIDSIAFFGMSLERSLKMIGADVQKQEKPKDLGKRVIPKHEVAKYLQTDVMGEVRLLEHIVELHERYQIKLCYSLPMMAGRIFRHYYMRKDFVRPNKKLIHGAMLSYHGGKNYPVTPEQKKSLITETNGRMSVGRWFKDCYDLDVRSAYPEAMRQLPDFENGKWEIFGKRRDALKHPHGIYRVTGRVSRCKWGCLFTHGFKPAFGRVRNLWVTGYELIEAIRAKHLKIEKVMGYAFVENASRYADGTAFSRFVAHFYEMKEKAETKAERLFYKLILNSLYGKFIQRNPIDPLEWTGDEDDELRPRLVAGSMFDPTVASLITGYVRAKIHTLEHKYDAIHTATDGFITQKKPDPSDVGEELGMLKQETFGPCLIIRNKLYLHYNQDGSLSKTGLHGYEGTPEELIKLWTSSKRQYSIERLTSWAEAWHIGLPPGSPLERMKELKL